MGLPGNPEASWGLSEDATFEVSALTPDYDDNKRVAVVKQTDNFILYVDYDKGAETEMQVQVSFSMYKDTDSSFARESIVAVSDGIVTPFFYRFTVSGTYRLAIPISPNEVLVEVAARGFGGVPDGSANFQFTTANLRSR